MPPEILKIIKFCSTYKQKQAFLIFTYLIGFGKVLENDHRSPFADIEFHGGRRGQIEVSGCPKSPPKSVFWTKQIVRFSEAPFLN